MSIDHLLWKSRLCSFPRRRVGISLEFVPQFEHVRIMLASPAEIDALAKESGDFLYLVIGAIELAADSARIDVGLTWAQSQESRRRTWPYNT